MKERLNGYWVSKEDPSIGVFIERVFKKGPKKGYVTGFSYVETIAGTVHAEFKATNEQLLNGFKRK